MGYRINHGQLLSPIELKQKYRQCKYKRQLDLEYENWDTMYGDTNYRYSVYVLTDSTKPGSFTYGFLTFTHEPFYVGCGIINRRVQESSRLGRQMEREYSYKIQRMIKIKKAGGTLRHIIIGNFYTDEKAKLVERKIIHLIRETTTRLENSIQLLCAVPLMPSDCNVMMETEIVIL